MHLRTRTWFVISLLCFLGAAVFWQLGERKAARDKARREAATPAPNTVPAANAPAAPQAPTAPAATNAAAISTNDPLRFRVSNTSKSVDELLASDRGLLLQNASVDSSAPIGLNIPPHLLANGDPGAFVVQARGPLTDAYRSLLRVTGAEIVSYVPNNAYLVRATQAEARQLENLADTQVVLPWHPYYKLLDTELLEAAVDQKPLLIHRTLNLLVFSDGQQAVDAALDAMRAAVLGQERSPFGWQYTVRIRPESLVAVAQLPEVQSIEIFRARALANDITRARLRVSTNTIVAEKYKNLTGEGVLVNVNDTGVDAQHPALSGRVTGQPDDIRGHGTHVAGTIAGDGDNGPQIPPKRVPGSATNANFRGMAPGASIYSLRFDTFGDAALQENAAKTNAFISNNSWGYSGANGYSAASASWDAAVRDALPGMTGSQPLLAVFSAGNSGDAGIDSPGTAKNVITVGALENRRLITNRVTVIEDGITNISQPWLGMTDSSNQVASFSSVGNVGRRREGEGGRFKPDVVAPGTFVVSARARNWVQPTNLYSVDQLTIPLISLDPGESDSFAFFVAKHGITIDIATLRNQLTRQPGPGLPPINISIQANTPPAPAGGVANATNLLSYGPPLAPRAAAWFVTVENPGDEQVRFDLRTSVTRTNNLGDEPEVLYNLNQELADDYRYETGTSMAAPAVSGVLALMQEYFLTRGVSNSPAMMKALLINGARNPNEETYDFNAQPTRNFMGWGLINLTNNLPATDQLAYSDQTFTTDTFVGYDQTTTRALETGDSFTKVVNVAANARTAPLRFTLVWTDPPGNPAVGVKLVNDLDLIVTNLSNGQVYVGNAFRGGSQFSPPSTIIASNDVATDRVNNVENIYLNGSFSQRLSNSYSVTVVARRVNVNAVTAHPDGVVQDFALVISQGNPRTTTERAISVGSEPVIDAERVEVTTVTNGIPLLNQRVGANSPLLAGTNGALSQWHFFVVTNRLPPSDPNFATGGAATNIAFATFLPPNLSIARTNRADIDLFVSLNRDLTNLNPAVIATSRRSVKRGGTESVVLTGADAVDGELYYIGVKSEDQQAATFGFFAISSSLPFTSEDEDGNVYIQGFPINVEIPDGSPAEPQAGFMFAFCTEEIPIQNVVVTNSITHTNGGDLFGTLSLEGSKVSVLNANRSFSSLIPITYIYDDSDSGEIPQSIPTDFPGTLRNFVGEEGLGLWQLTMVDSAPGATGQVNRLLIRLEPRLDDLTNGVGITRTILPGRFFFTAVDVPADATNLSVCVAPENGPLEVYIRRGEFPDRDNYDIFGTVAPPGNCVTLGRRDAPPLSRGRYFIGIFNPNPTPISATITIIIDRDLAKKSTLGFGSGGATAIFDDATTNSVINVRRNQIISDVQVGVRIEHERVSDLVLHLVSPRGTRILLAENRGGPGGANFGFGSLQTNVIPRSSTGDVQPDTNIITTDLSEGTIQIDYNFYNNPDQLKVYYEDSEIFDSGLVNGAGVFSIDYGPGIGTNILITMNENGNRPMNLWDYTVTILSGYNYAIFTENTNLAPLPIKFATPPYTNFNYFATNSTVDTNFVGNVVISDGFDAGLGICPVNAPAVFSGWSVVSGSVDIIHDGCGFFGVSHSGANGIDLQGHSAGTIRTNFPTVPGNQYRLSFAYTRNPNSSTPSQEQARQAEVRVGNAPPLLLNVRLPNTNRDLMWQTTSTVFTATSPLTTLEMRSLEAGGSVGVFIDTVQIQEVGRVRTETVRGLYFLPEEPLVPLRGENSFGNWQLEVWDNRVGGGATNVLLSWKLYLTFVNTNYPAIPLTNGEPVCLTLGSNEVAYFRVDVPITAAAATNAITGSGSLDLLFNQTGEPIGTEPPDTVFLDQVNNGSAVLGIFGWNSFGSGGFAGGSTVPSLQPGKRYYLAVRNREPGANNICMRVDFDQLTPNLIGIIPLTNGCYTKINSATNGIDYYLFDVTSNALGAQFEVTGITNGNVDLVIRRGIPLPTLASNYASSVNLGTTNEFIEVDDFFGTLLPGRWYIGVVHQTNDPVSYTVCARERQGWIQPIVTNRIYNTNVSVGLDQVQYFKVVISSNAYLADFVLTNVLGGTADMDLYISTNTMTPLFQAPTNWMYASTNGLTSESIRVSGFALTNPLTPGIWFLAAVNRSGTPVNFNVLVTEYTTNLPYITLTNGVPFAKTATPTDPVGLYKFDVATNALQVVFDTFGANGDVDLYLRYGSPVPFPNPTNFTHSSTNLVLTNEFILLLPGTTQPVLPGTWYVSVIPKTGPPPNVSYSVRVTQILSSDVTTLTNGQAVCRRVPVINTNALHTGVHFYSIVVPNGPVEATFELLNASGNVDLYVQRGLPLTNYAHYTSGNGTRPYPYHGENLGSTNEFIEVSTNSLPVSLSPGTWYITVVNHDVRRIPVDYCVRASLVSRANMTELDNGVEHCAFHPGVTNGSAISGVDYYVFNTTNAVQAMFEVYNLSGDVDLFVARQSGLTNFSTYIPLTNYPYFSTNIGTNSEFIVVLTNSVPEPLSDGPWYLAVVNRSSTNGAFYCVRATQLRESDFNPATNGVPICRQLAAGNGAANFGIDYYRIDVAGSPVLAMFETYNASGNVDLYVSRDLPLTNYATYNSAFLLYPYASTNLGAASESITITSNSFPVALTNGTWYAAVVNRSGVSVDYCFVSTLYATNPAIVLTNAVPLCGQVVETTNNGVVGVNYYVFNVSSNAIRATFEVEQMSGNVDLYVQKGFGFQNRTTFGYGTVNSAYWSTNFGLADESVCLSVGESPVSLTPGEWYLAVVNRAPGPSTFCVRATELLDTAFVGLTNGVGYRPVAGIAAGDTQFYHYRVSPDAIEVNFEILQPSGNVDLFLEGGLCSTDVNTFAYSSVNPGTANELVVLNGASTPVPLAPGEWLIAVINNDAGAVGYTVRVTEIRASTIVRLTNAISYTNSVEASGSLVGAPVDYYVFNVSPGSTRAQFEVIAPSGDVSLLARKGLPLPNLGNASVASLNVGANDELIMLFTNGAPVALTPGDWYLAVVNNAGAPVTYSVKATEYPYTPSVLYITRIQVDANGICLTWTNSLEGVNYYVQGVSNLVGEPWVAVSQTVKAIGTSVQACFPQNGYRFFRIVEGLSPLSVGGTVSMGNATFGAGGLTLNWTSQPNLQFIVEWTPTLQPPNWQAFPGTVTSATANYTFTDAAAPTNANTGRFYRVLPSP